MKPTLLLNGLGVVVFAFVVGACSGEITNGSDPVVAARPPVLAATAGAQTDPAVALSRSGRLSWLVNHWRKRAQPNAEPQPLPAEEQRARADRARTDHAGAHHAGAHHAGAHHAARS